MAKIEIFTREIDDGVGEAVASQNSIAYYSPASIHKIEAEEEIDPFKVLEGATSENQDQLDLYYLESVLVSTNWNKNDDVFLASSTWEARNTPEDKPFNFMHNENDIIGHITSSYVVDREGNIIDDDTPTPPTDFDIRTKAVLYNAWTNPDNAERIEKIISEIEQDKWFVSMECLFAGFDYSVLDSQGVQKVIARNEQSAFLTKHLRSYGGTGEYEGYRIGRALKNILFSGKGLVSNPANPQSIILKNSKSIAFSVDTVTDIGETNMSDTKILEEQLDAVKAELEAAQARITELEAAEVEAKAVAFDLQTLKVTLEEKDAAIDGLNATVALSATKVSELTEALSIAEANFGKSKEELEEMKKKEKEEKRKASLIEAGFDAEEVEASLTSFDSLEDGAFNDIVALYSKKKVAEVTSEETQETEATEEAEADEVDAEVFEGVESDEITHVEASDETEEVESTRAAISEWISTSVISSK